METRRKIGFLGAGNMARAIINGIIARGICTPQDIAVSDVVESQVQGLVESLGVAGKASNREVAKSSDVIILCTKPFQAVEVCTEIAPSMRADAFLISICAGIPTRAMEQALGGEQAVVRVMPNTPALLGCGSTGIAAGKFASEEQLAYAKSLFDAVGVSIIVPEEKLDLVTGLTGSGPAYVFRFMESLIQAGQDLGLSEDEAKTLVPQMVLGSARLAVEGNLPLHKLRENVTTKGGTTEAGLKVLEEGDFPALIHAAVKRATERSRELAGA